MREKEIDYSIVERAASLNCTIFECAVLCDCSESVIKRHAANDPKFIEAWEKGKARLRIKLRNLQLRHASGFGPQAVTMTIHMAKHILGETDKTSIEVGGTIHHQVSLQQQADMLTAGVDPRCLTKEEAIELSQLCEDLDEAGSLRVLGAEKRARMLALIEKGSSDGIIEGEFTEVTPQLPKPEEQSDVEQKSTGDSEE